GSSCVTRPPLASVSEIPGPGPTVPFRRMLSAAAVPGASSAAAASGMRRRDRRNGRTPFGTTTRRLYASAADAVFRRALRPQRRAEATADLGHDPLAEPGGVLVRERP